MGQQTRGSKSDALSMIERALDDNADYIGEIVWLELNKAYEEVDSIVSDLEDELETANDRIKELEDEIQRMERET